MFDESDEKLISNEILHKYIIIQVKYFSFNFIHIDVFLFCDIYSGDSLFTCLFLSNA